MSRRGLRFADAPALVIFCALLAYLIAGAVDAARNDLRYEEAKSLSLEIGGETLSGIAIAPEALRRDGEVAYVWVITAGRAEKKTINIIHASDELILAQAEGDVRSLRPGDKLITEGSGLYEGKILT